MKIFFTLILILSFGFSGTYSQSKTKEVKFSPVQLHEDLAQLKYLINHVHVNPNTELSSQKYNLLFDSIDSKLKDSATATDFLKQVKPIIAYLSDEHSQINLSPNLLTKTYKEYPIYPPFTLQKEGKKYLVDNILEANCSVTKGEQILEINGISIEAIIKNCALATTGFPTQRTETALHQFGYLYPWTNIKSDSSFNIKTDKKNKVNVKGTSLKVWDAYLAKQHIGSDCEERLSYKRYQNVGYINACSFDAKTNGKYSLDSIRHKIDNIFRQIELGGVKKLIIDVSHNEGGNSSVGDYLMSCFYDKPYKDYQTDWKRSEEYLKLLKSWGIENSDYAATPTGEVIHYPSETIPPSKVPYHFNGKVFIVVGSNTFSSAMTFATIIKDNKIATLIGQTPINGHPNGFGEMFYTNLTNTKVFVRFGVKEHIRPAGKIKENYLVPDITLSDAQMANINELIKRIE